MNDDELARTDAIIDGPQPRQRRWRTLTLSVGGLAAAAALAVAGFAIAGGGGGDDSPGVAQVGSTATTAAGSSPSGSGGSERDQALAYSRCMRQHGIQDFPDPNENGGLAINANGPDSDLVPTNPQYQAADTACKHLLPNGGEPPPPDPELRTKMLEYSKCMRNHGIGDFPDPNSDGTLQLQATPGSDLSPDNPQFHAADTACKHFMPNGGKGGSLSQGNGNGKG
jgi:hypothetical protein